MLVPAVKLSSRSQATTWHRTPATVEVGSALYVKGKDLSPLALKGRGAVHMEIGWIGTLSKLVLCRSHFASTEFQWTPHLDYFSLLAMVNLLEK